MAAEDNQLLVDLLTHWSQTPTQDLYASIVKELVNGESFLYVPGEKVTGTEEKIDEGTAYDLAIKTVFFTEDGVKTLGAFSTKEALLTWSKDEVEHVCMPAQNVLEFCRTNEIVQVVIDSAQATQIVLVQDQEEDSTTLVGDISAPLPLEIISMLVGKFGKIKAINNVYQFEIVREGEHRTVLGFELDEYTDGNMQACLAAIKDEINPALVTYPIEAMPLDMEYWLEKAKELGYLLYQRGDTVI